MVVVALCLINVVGIFVDPFLRWLCSIVLLSRKKKEMKLLETIKELLMIDFYMALLGTPIFN